jgi:tetratricopeptide (TPR) repeat protein
MRLKVNTSRASNFYSDLSYLQQTREEKIKSLETAVKYIEEAIKIRRELGLRADLSMSLNNASGSYLDLSYLQQTREEKIKSLETAVRYIKEAIEIYRELGLLLDLADSLAVSVFVYDSSIKFNPQLFSQAMKNCDEAIDIFLKFSLKEKYRPLLLFGIKYHQLMNALTGSQNHQIRISTYQQILSSDSP